MKLLPVLIIFCVFYFVLRKNVNTTQKAKALILTCMDYRYIDDIHRLLSDNNYNDDYNHVVLAGGSLGYNQNKYTEWKKTINTHINLAIQLHNITEIIVIDHMDCGAYRLLYNNPKLTYDEEFKLHATNLKSIKTKLSMSYPQLKVRTFLLDLDGINKLIE